MSELTDAGLDLDSFDDLVTSMGTDWVERTGVAPEAVAEDSPDGILIRIVAERIASVNDLAQAVVSVIDRDAATGAGLVSTAALTGTLQEAAYASGVDLLLAGDPLTPIPANRQASDPASDTIWETVEATTIVDADAWVNTTAYAVYDVVTNGGNIYYCITAGTSAGSGGPTTEDSDITDGSVHWRFVGAGTGAVIVAALATETGPKTGDAGTIVDIETPVSGWSGVINMADAELGADLETDRSLRLRAAAELTAQGVSVAAAIRAELLKVADVEEVRVFVNDTDETDGNGIPPHSFMAVVLGGAQQDIFDQLLASKPDGIRAYGTTSGTATDDEGTEVDLAYTIMEEVPIYVEATLEIDADLYPSTGDTLAKEKIAAFGNALISGQNVRARALGSSACSRFDANGTELGVAGVLDATATKISIAPSPTLETTIAISLFQRATFDTANIDIVTSPVTP